MGYFDELFTGTEGLQQPMQPQTEDVSFLRRFLDFLSRGQYASAAFADSLANDAQSTFLTALTAAKDELINPQKKLSYSDIIEKQFPDFAKEHGFATSLLGLTGDILLDPTTYIPIAGWAGKGKGALTAAGKLKYAEELAKAAELFPKAEKAATWAEELLREAKIRKIASEGVTQAMATADTALRQFEGLKIGGVPVLPAEVWNNISKVTGLSKVAEWAGQKIEPLALLVNRNYKWPEEILSARKGLEARMGQLTDEAKYAWKKLMIDMNEEQRVKIGQTMHNIRDEGAKYFDELVAGGMEKDAAAQATFDKAQEFREKIFSSMQIKKDEQDVIARLFRADADIGKTLQEAGLLQHVIANHTPRIYNEIRDPVSFLQDIPDLRNPFVAANKPVTISTLEEAVKFGKKPELDALTLYTNRYIEAVRAVEKKKYKDILLEAFPAGVPEKFAKDFRFIGEGDYASGLPEGMKSLLKVLDRSTNVFRKFATSLRVSFGPKQAFANTLQEMMTMGVKAAGSFDPRVMLDAGTLLALNSSLIPPESELLGKVLKSGIKNDFGEKQTFEQLLDEMRKRGIFSGRNLTSIESAGRNIKKEIDYERAISQKVGKDYEGLAKVLIGTANYMQWPSMIENMSKASMYLNLKRLGYSADDAAAKTYQTLFDYARGLSQFERRVARRIVPFYSFQRFAGPLIAKTLIQHPGRIANIDKTVRGLFEAFAKFSDGEPLSESERYMLPGYLLEQIPFGKDKEGKAVFRRYQNINPIDTLDTIELDELGNLDFTKTMQRTVMAQLAPFLKMPIEWLADRNFFTDRAISPAQNSRSGIIGDVSASGVLSNILGMVGASQLGIPGIAAGKAIGELIPDEMAEPVMKAIGWEQGIDPKRGERTIYINPYVAWGSTSMMPVLSQAIRIERNKNNLDNWLDLVAGINTQRVNPLQAGRAKYQGKRYEIQEAMRLVREAFYQQRYDLAEQRKAELEALINAMMAQELTQ